MYFTKGVPMSIHDVGLEAASDSGSCLVSVAVASTFVLVHRPADSIEGVTGPQGQAGRTNRVNPKTDESGTHVSIFSAVDGI